MLPMGRTHEATTYGTHSSWSYRARGLSPLVVVSEGPHAPVVPAASSSCETSAAVAPSGAQQGGQESEWGTSPT